MRRRDQRNVALLKCWDAVVFAFGFPKPLEVDDVALLVKLMALTMTFESFDVWCDSAGLDWNMLAFASESAQNGSS